MYFRIVLFVLSLGAVCMAREKREDWGYEMDRLSPPLDEQREKSEGFCSFCTNYCMVSRYDGSFADIFQSSEAAYEADPTARGICYACREKCKPTTTSTEATSTTPSTTTPNTVKPNTTKGL